MKKNTKTYLLLGAVAVIWGMIGYRLISGMTNDAIPDIANKAVAFKPLPVQEKETFTILADYRDPFLGTLPKKALKKVKRSTKPKAPPVAEVVISYTGFVADTATKQNIFFVTINGQQHLMSLRDVIDKVQLLSGNATSIRIRHNNKTRTITLKE